MEEVVNVIMNNGIGVVLLAYFIYKDNKFNTEITNTLQSIREVLAELRVWHAKETDHV